MVLIYLFSQANLPHCPRGSRKDSRVKGPGPHGSSMSKDILIIFQDFLIREEFSLSVSLVIHRRKSRRKPDVCAMSMGDSKQLKMRGEVVKQHSCVVLLPRDGR